MLLKKMSPARVIVLGFLSVILIGTAVLLLPMSVKEGIKLSFVDALFTATSAVCVTGLVVVDTGDTFSLFGQIVVGVLIQVGGLGVTSLGVMLILLTGGKVGIKERVLVKETLNLYSVKGMVQIVKAVLYVTIFFELVGALISYTVFVRDYGPVDSMGIAIFHSVAAFNNAGFDVLGGFKSLSEYRGDVVLNITTSVLIIFGGLGFFVIKEILQEKNFRKLSLYSKAVISTTIALLLGGTLLLKFTEKMTWLESFFCSTSARTAGFMTFPTADITTPGLLLLIILMFIGASPGSTGGGIKTTTTFVIWHSLYSFARNQYCEAFRRKIPEETIRKAYVIATLAFLFVTINTLIISVTARDLSFHSVLFEVVSAFGTVGLSTGITPELNTISKLVLTTTMFIGRVGPLTMVSIWFARRPAEARYTEESVTIG